MKNVLRELIDKKVRIKMLFDEGYPFFCRIRKIDGRFVSLKTSRGVSVVNSDFIESISLKEKDGLMPVVWRQDTNDIHLSIPSKQNSFNNERSKKNSRNGFSYAKWWKRENVHEVD